MSFKRNYSYLKYLIKHKWYVFIAARKIKASLWKAFVHDLSKFLPSEWFPYAETFYDSNGSFRYIEAAGFREAWLKHQKRNPHHWQYWILKEDNGCEVLLPIPDVYLLEMVADWAGAGKAIAGIWDINEWYQKNKEKILMEEGSKEKVGKLIDTNWRSSLNCTE